MSMLPEPLLARGMQAACKQARRWLGATAPNPPVGAAALDAQGGILGVVGHERAGGPHAEAALLAQMQASGLLARVHTLCVTLEPCNHHGRTPPCCDAILAAGIQHVAVGVRDPNPKVAGGGIERLAAQGVTVMLGVEEKSCAALLYAFSFAVTQGRPWVTVKRALDEQGSMIPPPGQKTFTGAAALKLAHRLRKRADAILTGGGTILADHPCFTVRHVPDHAGKKRILAILDRRRRVPDGYLTEAAKRGLVPMIYDGLPELIGDLAKRGARDILVEAGPQVTETVLSSPYWTQEIAIQKAVPDRITLRYNPAIIAEADWALEDMLPEDSA